MSNLGTAIEQDGSATVRMIALQHDFVLPPPGLRKLL